MPVDCLKVFQIEAAGGCSLLRAFEDGEALKFFKWG
jgi:hypothetical protein